ncbi:hypothetical protein CgunFtcFv8_020132 [Champsocephalus gunnari]|uniref:Uncharacterized protein n=1 Tax=Champsocephalus gunnari TaxID=52237 RepID=A0AAN8DIG4_CHAGU|nr:hypothetical protein CgunFtcFv8_020132 [Champsocephalus gunnari]
MTLSGSRSLRTDLSQKEPTRQIFSHVASTQSPPPHTHNSPHPYGSNTSPPDGTRSALQGQAKGMEDVSLNKMERCLLLDGHLRDHSDNMDAISVANRSRSLQTQAG